MLAYKIFRKIAPLLMCLFIICTAEAQLWRRVKDQAKSRVEQKANQVINKTIDNAVDSIGKKKSGKQTKQEKEKPVSQTQQNNQLPQVENGSNIVSTEAGLINVPQKKENTNSEGFIEMTPSSPFVFVTGMVTLTGRSINYKEYNKINVVITCEEVQYKQEKEFFLNPDGSFVGVWFAPGLEGDYEIRAISPDKKAIVIVPIKVYDTPDLDEMADENINQTKKVQQKLQERIDKVKPMISSQQASELDKKMKEVEKKIAVALKLFESINEANRKLAAMIGKGKPLPKSMSGNLSEMNDILHKQAEEMKQQQEFLNHQPAENTICEYLVMINEACAAFSTFSGGSMNILKVIKNIVLDKAPGMSVDKANNAIGNNNPDPASTAITKEASKLYITSKVDAEGLVGKLASAQFAGDVLSFVTDILLKMYCGLYTGEMTQTFNFDYKNNGISWWKYGGELKATLNLRYPKSGNTGRVIKMKGSLEGNATKFTFWADPKEAVAEELKSAYNSTQVITILDLKAPAVPFVSSQVDKAGFGAVARGLVTPASFYIPIDAEYNLDSKEIKFFINPAILDFFPTISNRKFFVVIAVLPLFRWQDFPVEKAFKLVRGSVKDKNFFKMSGEESGTPQFSGTITRKVTDPEFTIDLSINLKGKKD
jgi:hypothetical protein